MNGCASWVKVLVLCHSKGYSTKPSAVNLFPEYISLLETKGCLLLTSICRTCMVRTSYWKFTLNEKTKSFENLQWPFFSSCIRQSHLDCLMLLYFYRRAWIGQRWRHLFEPYQLNGEFRLISFEMFAAYAWISLLSFLTLVSLCKRMPQWA